MSTSYSSDEDELPLLLDVSIPPAFFAKTNEKSLGDLLSATISLKDNIKSEREKCKVNIPLDDALPQEVFSQTSPALSFEESKDTVDVHPFGKLGTLRYFNVGDLSLWRCGYYCVPPEELSKTEKVLLFWSEEELLDAVGQAVKGISVDNVPNLNPIMHYILKLMSIHVDSATVNCCAQFIKKMLSQHLDVASISFSSAEVFMILFNYGVDVENDEIFQMFPSIKAIEVNLSCAHKLPVQWKYNLRTVLNCLADIFQYCKFNKDDLCNMLIYLLWMSIDRTLKASFIYQELQTCLCNVILSFTDQMWPICLSRVSQTLMSKGSLPVSKQWSHVLDMTRAIPYIICRGVQLRKQICLVALRHLSGEVPGDSPFGYPDESCVISELQDILESICYIEKHLQSIAFGFVGTFVTLLKFTSDKDYTSLCKSVKDCDYAIRNSCNQVSDTQSAGPAFSSQQEREPAELLEVDLSLKEAQRTTTTSKLRFLSSMNLQHQVMRIYSTLILSSPKPRKIFAAEKDTSDEGDSDDERVADKESDTDDERVECIVENNTEYTYPLVLPPMIMDKYVPENNSLVSISKREFEASGYLSDVKGIGNKAVSSCESMDDKAWFSSKRSKDDSDLSEYKSVPKLPSAHLKDIPSLVISTSHIKNEVDNHVSHLSSSNSHLQGQNNLHGNGSQDKTVLKNNDASNCSMDLSVALEMEVSSSNSCSETGSSDTFCHADMREPDLKVSLLYAEDKKESNSKDNTSNVCIRSSETICTANPTDNSMFVASDKEAPILNMSKKDELLMTKPINDIQGKIWVENNDGALTVKTCSRDKCSSVASEMEVSSNLCSETESSFDTFCDASIRETNQEVSVLHADNKEETKKLKQKKTKHITSDVCIESSEMICTADPIYNSMFVSSGLEVANLSVSKGNDLPISSSNSNQIGHANSEDLSSLTQKYNYTIDVPNSDILKDPVFKKACFKDEFLTCLSQMVQKKQSAKMEGNSSSCQSNSAKVEEKSNSSDFSTSVISTEEKVSGNNNSVSEGNKMNISAEMEENSNLSRSCSANMEEKSNSSDFSTSVISTEEKVSGNNNSVSEGNEMNISAEMEENSNLSQSYSANMGKERSNSSDISLSIIYTGEKVSPNIDLAYEGNKISNPLNTTSVLECMKENVPLEYKADFIASNLSVHISSFCQQHDKADFIASNGIVHISAFHPHSLELERCSSEDQSKMLTSSDCIQEDKVNVTCFATSQSICEKSLESLDSHVSTKKLETIPFDFEFNRATPDTSDHHQIVNKEFPSSKSISNDNSSLQDTCMLQNIDFPSEATDNAHRIPVQNTCHGTSSKEEITEVTKGTEVFKQQLPPERMNDNCVPIHDDENVDELSVMERGNIQPSNVSKCSRKFQINSVKRFNEYDTVASVTDAKMDIVSNSLAPEIHSPSKTESCYRVDESLSSRDTSVLFTNLNKDGGNLYNVESADEVVEACSEFLPKEPVEKELQVVPPSVQERSSQLDSKKSTSVSERQDDSFTDSSNVPTTSASHLNELQVRRVTSLEKDLSSLELTNAAIPESSDNCFGTSVHFLTGGSNTIKPFMPFLSEEEGCFTSSFAVSQVGNGVGSNFNLLTGSSFEENVNSIESEQETNADQRAILHLNAGETHSSDDDIQIVDFVIRDKGTENSTINSAKRASLETKRLSTSPSHSNAGSGSNQSVLDCMPSCLESSTTLPKESSISPQLEATNGLRSSTTRCDRPLLSKQKSSTPAIENATPTESSVHFRLGTKNSTGPFTLPNTQVNDAPAGVVRDPGDFDRSQSTITRYLSPKNPISPLNPSKQRSLTPVLDNSSRSSTSQSQLHRKRSFTPSPSTSSIVPFLVEKDMNSSSKWKRQLFNETLSTTVEGTNATSPRLIATLPSTAISEWTTPSVPGTSHDSTYLYHNRWLNDIPQGCGSRTLGKERDVRRSPKRRTTPSVSSIHAVPGTSQKSTYPKQNYLLNYVPQNSQVSGSSTGSENAQEHSLIRLYRFGGFLNKRKASIPKRLQQIKVPTKKEKPSPKKLKLSEMNDSRASTTAILELSDSSDDSDIEVLLNTVGDDCVIVSEVKESEIITIEDD